MKPIAEAIVVFSGAYLLVAAAQFGAFLPTIEPVGYATMAIGVFLLFVAWTRANSLDKPLWLRFTIRDLFWLTLLAALLVAWWLDHQSLQSKIAVGQNPVVGQGGGGGGF